MNLCCRSFGLPESAERVGIDYDKDMQDQKYGLCQSCKYFSRLWNSREQFYLDEGVCKRYPPIVLLDARFKRGKKSKVNGEYAHVVWTFSCSAWQCRESEGYQKPLPEQYASVTCSTCPECKHCQHYQKIDDLFGRCRFEYRMEAVLPELAAQQWIQTTRGDSKDRIVAREYWCGAFTPNEAALKQSTP